MAISTLPFDMHPTTAHVLKTYDYLIAARTKIFDAARALTPHDHAKAFDIGPGSLQRTLAHMVGAEWYYVQRLIGAELATLEGWPINEEEPPGLPVIEATWSQQAQQTRAALEAVDDWQAEIRYDVPWGDDPRRVIATASDLFTQLVMHEVHHRAQLLNMLRRLGAPAGDLDYNEMCYRFEPL